MSQYAKLHSNKSEYAEFDTRQSALLSVIIGLISPFCVRTNTFSKCKILHLTSSLRSSKFLSWNPKKSFLAANLHNAGEQLKIAYNARQHGAPQVILLQHYNYTVLKRHSHNQISNTSHHHIFITFKAVHEAVRGWSVQCPYDQYRHRAADRGRAEWSGLGSLVNWQGWYKGRDPGPAVYNVNDNTILCRQAPGQTLFI